MAKNLKKNAKYKSTKNATNKKKPKKVKISVKSQKIQVKNPSKSKQKQKKKSNKKSQARLKLSKMVVRAQIEDGDQWEEWLEKEIFKNKDKTRYQLWLDAEMENSSVCSLPDFLEEYECSFEGDEEDYDYK